ncbi:MAG: iron export ABC transporter permease subunit FetB [Hyphomicrobiaceae bacterium]|nr:iron export ABC transporter permease subunit FetB [Hyphomicrobiaceae bacterium]
MSYVPLSWLDLSAAAVLIVINGGLSWALRLGLERSIALATLRMIVQLGAIGFVLKFVFEQTSPLLTAAMALVMVAVAGHEALARQETRIGGWAAYGIGTGTLFFVGLLATVYTMTVVIGPEPWYAPRYVLPILGMILGNTLTGVALVFNAVTQAARRDRAAIEARLALGATRFEATSGVVLHAVKTGLMPILNAMAASGIVTLPGMMTGQILAGIDPIEAAKYQIMIMFLISAATALGVMTAAVGGAWLITDARHRLRVAMLGAA